MKRSQRVGVTAALGFAAAAGRAGIAGPGRRDDLALVVSDRPAVAVGMFTTNQVKAAPIVWSRAIVRSGRRVGAVLINSGNANACTGSAGDAAARRCAVRTARGLRLGDARRVLLASTGVIGVPLPVERVLAALPAVTREPSRGAGSARAAARAIMTTDTRPKQDAVTVRAGGRSYTVGGMAKGAGMIHPQMATMLCVLTTDAPLPRRRAQALLRRAVERSFNALTVDGDTSTNDCVLLLANGAAGGRVTAGSVAEASIASALEQVCLNLAEGVAADGEGASKMMRVHVSGARTDADAQAVARTVASSMLVKTAVHGGDPNWGRVLAAAGRAGVRLDPDALDLSIGGHRVATAGAARPEGERAAARHMRGRRVLLDLRIGRGTGRAFALGSDLSARYVRINAHYRT